MTMTEKLEVTAFALLITGSFFGTVLVANLIR